MDTFPLTEGVQQSSQTVVGLCEHEGQLDESRTQRIGKTGRMIFANYGGGHEKNV